MEREASEERGQNRRAIIFLAVAIALGLALRWWRLSVVDTQPVTDFSWYFARAKELAAGQGYVEHGKPTAYWPVGWPGFLGLLFKVFGASVWVGKIANTLLSLAAIPLTFALGHRLFHSRTTGLIGAFFMAVNPAFVAYSGILASEPLFTTLTLAGMLLLIKGEDKAGGWFWGGALFGLAVLVRPQAAVLPALILVAHWLWDSRWKREFPFWRAIWTSHAAMICVLLPWLIRCYIVFGSLVFVSTNGGDNLLIGAHPSANGRYANPWTQCGLTRAPNTPELQWEKKARGTAIFWIKQNPGRWLALAPAKLNEAFIGGTDIAYWSFQKEFDRLRAPGTGDDKPLYKQFQLIGNQYKLLLLALFGVGLAATLMARFSKRERPALPISPLFVIAASALVVVVFFGNSRFVMPIAPLMGLYAAHGFVSLKLMLQGMVAPAKGELTA